MVTIVVKNKIKIELDQDPFKYFLLIQIYIIQNMKYWYK